MKCPNCQQETAPGVAFCGNCGFQLPAQPAQPPTVPDQQTEAVPTPPPQPEAVQPVQQPQHVEPTAVPVAPVAPAPPPAPAYQSPPPNVSHNNGKATAAMVFGLVGLVGWLLPIAGVVLGILALIFGTIALKSQKRTFAIIGVVLAVPVLALSIFFWVRNAQAILKQREDAASSLNDPNAKLSKKEVISSPCYTTKIPTGLTVSQADDSCTFQATNTTEGDQIVVKVLAAETLTGENLAERAQADAESTVNQIPGGTISKQEKSSFAGSPAYKVTIEATDGSAGVIYYVYKKTAKGNLVVVLRTQSSGKGYDTAFIEQNWTWK